MLTFRPSVPSSYCSILIRPGSPTSPGLRQVADSVCFSQPRISWQPKINYRALDPLLTPQEIQLYQHIEKDWSSLVKSVPSGNITALKSKILNLPFITIEPLPNRSELNRSEQNLDSDSEFALEDPASGLDIEDATDTDSDMSSDSEMDNEQALAGNTEWNGEKATIQLPEAYFHQPEQNPDGFETLSHELVHALHCQDENTLPFFSSSALDDTFDHIEDLLHLTLGMIDSREEWPKQQQLSSIIQDTTQFLSFQDLQEIKRGLRSEAIAYMLASDLQPEQRDRDKQKVLAAGYQFAIHLMNMNLLNQFRPAPMDQWS